MFIPVPPKASFAINTAKITDIASIHNGISIGIIIGIRSPVTKYPSLTGWFLYTANANSIAKPTAYETAIIGKIL